jgi:hypothetical protein
MMANKAHSSLAAELQTFAMHRNELLGRAKGKYVLIKGEDVVDVFGDRTDALVRGYREFGNHPFLVKKVTDVEAPLNFESITVLGNVLRRVGT